MQEDVFKTSQRQAEATHQSYSNGTANASCNGTRSRLELRCVIGVIRHGDRTPKQKMKMLVTHKKFFDLFDELGGYKTGHLMIKNPIQLKRVLDTSIHLLSELERWTVGGGARGDCCCPVTEKAQKLEQLKSVMEMYGSISGINRKVQFKLLGPKEDPRLLLVAKWGGELTLSGRRQAEGLGASFQRCYYSQASGGSSQRDDLKVFASDEGRVQVTAASFTKALLQLDASLAYVLTHFVQRDKKTNALLDCDSSNTQELMDGVKERLHRLLETSEDISSKLAPNGKRSLVEAIGAIGANPLQACEHLHSKIHQLIGELRKIEEVNSHVGEIYHKETLPLMIKRWNKLYTDFKNEEDGRFAFNKIPDIYDCIKYDMLHNSHLGLQCAEDVLKYATPLADLVIPQEYGITKEEKLNVARHICSPLLRKIRSDLKLSLEQARGHISTRLYFTSESLVHAVLNALRYGAIVEDEGDPEWKAAIERLSACPELNYMTQIVFLLYEDMEQPYSSASRFLVKAQFSPGVSRKQFLATVTPGVPSTCDSGNSSPSLEATSDELHMPTKGLEPVSQTELEIEPLQTLFTTSLQRMDLRLCALTEVDCKSIITFVSANALQQPTNSPQHCVEQRKHSTDLISIDFFESDTVYASGSLDNVN